jgi:hypothetical protein
LCCGPTSTVSAAAVHTRFAAEGNGCGFAHAFWRTCHLVCFAVAFTGRRRPELLGVPSGLAATGAGARHREVM